MKLLSKITRRSLLKTTGSVLTMGAGCNILNASLAHSKNNNKKQTKPTFQAPGFFRFILGTYTITILSDGILNFPSKVLANNVPEAQLKAFLKANFSNIENHNTHVNSCLIDTGVKRILIDAGSGNGFQKTAGKFIKNLEKSGYTPEDIDTVVLSHAHPDHLWGIIDEKSGKPILPKANYIINEKEWDYWTQDSIESKVADSTKGTAKKTKEILISIADKTQRVKTGSEIIPGITILNTAGHTEGHVSVLVTSEKSSMIVSGDVIHHEYIAFEHPDWHFAFDADAEKAAKVRKLLLDQAALEESIVVGFHLPFPGVGNVARKGKVFRWVPIKWEWVQ